MHSLFRRPSAVASCLVAFVSIYFLASTYFRVIAEFPTRDFILVSLLSVLIIGAQIGLIVVVFRICSGRLLPNLLQALLICGNAYSLQWVLNGDFTNLAAVYQAAIALAALLVVYFIVKLVAEKVAIRRIVFAAVAVLLAAEGGEVAMRKAARNRIINGAYASADGNASAAIQNVKFTKTPNVYLIAFESMAPGSVLAAYHGVKDYPVESKFEKNGYRIFRNLFSERASTKQTLSSLLAMDPEYYLKAEKADYPMFSGRMRSPLLEIFKHNGYGTTTLFAVSYMGKQSGPHVDDYVVMKPFTICSFMAPIEQAFAFFGVCSWVPDELWGMPTEEKPEVDFLLDKMRELVKSGKPQFLMARITPLQHTAKEWRGSPEEVSAFLERYKTMAAAAAENIDKITTFIRQNDPTALVFIFGDHGPYMSRHIEYEADKAFFVRDRYGVRGAFYPESECRESFDQPYTAGYVTTPQVVRMMLRCLAGGTDPHVRPPAYRLWSRKATYDPAPYE